MKLKFPMQCLLLIAFLFQIGYGTLRAGIVLEAREFSNWEFEVVSFYNQTNSTAFLLDGDPDQITVATSSLGGPFATYVLLRDSGPSGISGAPVSIDPGSVGGISEINFSIDYFNNVSFGNGQAINLMVVQGGNAYLAGATFSGASGGGTVSRTVTESSFSRLKDPSETAGNNDWFAHGENPDFSENGQPFRVGFGIGESSSFQTSSPTNPIAVSYDNFRAVLEHELGSSQFDPILPGYTTDDGAYVFENIPSGQWYDPPVSDFHFQTLDNSKFTSILDLPTGFDDLFDVFVGDTLLGSFGPGDTVDFGGGVSAFSIRGINPLVDSEDPAAFPIKLDFDRDLVSFKMSPILQGSAVPEPATLNFLVAGMIFLTVNRRRHSLNVDGPLRN